MTIKVIERNGPRRRNGSGTKNHDPMIMRFRMWPERDGAAHWGIVVGSCLFRDRVGWCEGDRLVPCVHDETGQLLFFPPLPGGSSKSYKLSRKNASRDTQFAINFPILDAFSSFAEKPVVRKSEELRVVGFSRRHGVACLRKASLLTAETSAFAADDHEWSADADANSAMDEVIRLIDGDSQRTA